MRKLAPPQVEREVSSTAKVGRGLLLQQNLPNFHVCGCEPLTVFLSPTNFMASLSASASMRNFTIGLHPSPMAHRSAVRPPQLSSLVHKRTKYEEQQRNDKSSTSFIPHACALIKMFCIDFSYLAHGLLVSPCFTKELYDFDAIHSTRSIPKRCVAPLYTAKHV